MGVLRVAKKVAKRFLRSDNVKSRNEDVVGLILNAYDRAIVLSDSHREHKLLLVFSAIEKLFYLIEKQLKEKLSSGDYNDVFLAIEKLEMIISEFMPNMVDKIINLQKHLFTQAAEQAMMYAKDGYWQEANQRLSILSYVKEDMPGDFQGEALNLLKILEKAVALAVENARNARNKILDRKDERFVGIKHNMDGENHVEHIVIQKHNGQDYITKTYKSSDFEEAINKVTKNLKDIGFNVGASNIMVDKINDEYIATIVVRAGQ